MGPWESGAGRDDDAGRVIRKERYFPAYVRVVDDVTVGKIVGLDKDKDELSTPLDDNRSGVREDEGDEDDRFGRDEVRSMPLY